MQVLDDSVGGLNWEVMYQRDTKGVLQSTISIWDEDKKQWVSKTSNGTESNMEKEKGEYSDAFKRAGFMWGIGRQLYDMPGIIVYLNEKEYYKKDGKIKAKFYPNKWEWELSDNYKTVKAFQLFGNKKVQRVNIINGQAKAQ